jgi:hypothetical protein
MENNIKGAIAEQLTKELLFDAGYEVHYYGVEHLVPGFSNRTNGTAMDKSYHTNKVIRRLPDFLVVKDGRTYYVESKFRMEGRLVLAKDYPFPDAYIIQFTKEEIFIGLASKLISGEKTFESIKEYNPLEFSDEAILTTKQLLHKYFYVTDDWKQKESQKKLNKLLVEKKG